jgi:hypothetical protein
MRNARRFKALVSGLLLYTTAAASSSRLVELPWSGDFYSALGGPRSELAILAVASLIALLMFGLALAWSYLTVRPSSPGRRPMTGWCIGGIAAAWFCWVVYGVVQVAASPGLNDMPISAWLLSPDMPPLWGMLNTLAIVGGVVLAGELTRRLGAMKSPSSLARGA